MQKTFEKEQGRTLDLSTTVNCVEVRLFLSSCKERKLAAPVQGQNRSDCGRCESSEWIILAEISALT